MFQSKKSSSSEILKNIKKSSSLTPCKKFLFRKFLAPWKIVQPTPHPIFTLWMRWSKLTFQDIHKVKIGCWQNTLISEVAEQFFTVVFMSMFSVGCKKFSKKKFFYRECSSLLAAACNNIMKAEKYFELHHHHHTSLYFYLLLFYSYQIRKQDGTFSKCCHHSFLTIFGFNLQKQ